MERGGLGKVGRVVGEWFGRGRRWRLAGVVAMTRDVAEARSETPSESRQRGWRMESGVLKVESGRTGDQPSPIVDDVAAGGAVDRVAGEAGGELGHQLDGGGGVFGFGEKVLFFGAVAL